MSKEILYKTSFQNYSTCVHRDRSHIPNTDLWDGVHPIFNKISVHSDEEFYKENLKNPLCSVRNDSLMIVVEKNENKVCVKYFDNHFYREAGRPWFGMSKNVRYISVNINNGNVYVGEIINYHKKRACVKRVRLNYFVDSPVSCFFSVLKNILSRFTTEENYGITNQAYKIFLDAIDGGKISNLSYANRLLRFHLDKKGIKYPNNFSLYSRDLWGDFRKKLKKNENKLVDTFMQINGVSGKKLKKVLHIVNRLNIENYKNAIHLFGEQWISQDEKFLSDIISSENSFSLSPVICDAFKSLASPKEIKRAYQLFKFYIREQVVDNWTLTDHFRLYVQLKNYGDEEVEWKSSGDPKFFREEHLDWTDKFAFYKQGLYERDYPEYFQDYLNPIKNGKDLFFPILLSNSNEYNEESQTQSNCVKSYIGRASSLIISLRKNSDTSEDRLTVEYRVHYPKNSNRIHLDRVQTRAKYNSDFNDDWISPLEVLDQTMNSMFNEKKFQKYKLKKTCSNGKELESDTEFDNDGNLRWAYKHIDSFEGIFMI